MLAQAEEPNQVSLAPHYTPRYRNQGKQPGVTHTPLDRTTKTGVTYYHRRTKC